MSDVDRSRPHLVAHPSAQGRPPGVPAASLLFHTHVQRAVSREVVVTGAGRGIGHELVRQALDAGDTVTATCRSSRAKSRLLNLDPGDGRLRIVHLDVTDDHGVAAFGRILAEETDRLDVLVNNAGTGGGDRDLMEVEWQKMVFVFDTNTVGSLRVVRALLPLLHGEHHAVVANISTLMASVADNHSGGRYSYRASKAALNMVTKSLSLDLLPMGVTCVALHPGWVRTDMGGQRAPVPVEESARGLWSVINELEPEDAGRFLEYTGEELPW